MARPLNRAAAVGFERAADAYERGRPTYPDDVVDWLCEGLGIEPGRTVVDLAAGTGKLTRLLARRGADLIAVEPVVAMRSRLERELDGVRVLTGTAEAIPLEDEAVDAVTVGQAFHWFDLAAATAEIRRILRPGGGLGLVWNERDMSVGWVAELSRIIRWDERNRWQVPYTVEVDWAARFADEVKGFGPMERFDSGHRQLLDRATLLDRVLSTSYIAAGTDEERERIERQVLELVADFPDRFELPYVTVAYRCRRT